MDWKLIDVTEGKHEIDASIQKPIKFEEMKVLSKKLAKDKKFIRTDFYQINGKIYFGELTFFPKAGYEEFDPEYWNKKLGEMINLTN